MQNLVDAAEKLTKKPRIIFTSSLALYGSTMAQEPLRKVTDKIDVGDDHNRAVPRRFGQTRQSPGRFGLVIRRFIAYPDTFRKTRLQSPSSPQSLR